MIVPLEAFSETFGGLITRIIEEEEEEEEQGGELILKQLSKGGKVGWTW